MRRARLEKVIDIPKMKDEDNQMYIPYCSFFRHPGVPFRPLDCITKQCVHFQRFYADDIKDMIQRWHNAEY